MTIAKSVAIVIPVYADQLSAIEIISLKQCFKVLGQYDILFAAPDHLRMDSYLPFCTGNNYDVIKFDDKYFEDVDSYSQLLLSPSFYKKFLNYNYILIYQLDAFVFKDELLFWCDQNYDYIGAPHQPFNNGPGEMQFLKNYRKTLRFFKFFNLKHEISNVGNGGFSLRKTSTLYFFLILLRKHAKAWEGPEDGFFKYWGNIFYPLFKLPADELALKFSVELDPEASLKKLDNKLPFGCHAFEKYDWATWKPFILPDKN